MIFFLNEYVQYNLQVFQFEFPIFQLKEVLANKDNETVDSIRTAYSNLQQKSLKLFEMAYKKMAADRDQQTASGNQEQTEGNADQQQQQQTDEDKKKQQQ